MQHSKMLMVMILLTGEHGWFFLRRAVWINYDADPHRPAYHALHASTLALLAMPAN
jgi:hypothetical protein